MKTMLRVLNKSNMDTSKVTELSISNKSFFFTHELQKSHEIEVKQIRSSDNVVDLFTKALPSVKLILIRGSIIFKSTAYIDICMLYSFSFVQVFPIGFYWKGFNEAVSLVRPTSL